YILAYDLRIAYYDYWTKIVRLFIKCIVTALIISGRWFFFFKIVCGMHYHVVIAWPVREDLQFVPMRMLPTDLWGWCTIFLFSNAPPFNHVCPTSIYSCFAFCSDHEYSL